MYLKSAIVFLFCVEICKSELCKSACISTDENGDCLEFEVVEIFNQRPSRFPKLREMRNILQMHRGTYNGRRSLCPDTMNESGPKPVTSRPRERTTSTTEAPVTTTKRVIYPPVEDPYYVTTTESNTQENSDEKTERDPNSIYYDQKEHTNNNNNNIDENIDTGVDEFGNANFDGDDDGSDGDDEGSDDDDTNNNEDDEEDSDDPEEDEGNNFDSENIETTENVETTTKGWWFG